MTIERLEGQRRSAPRRVSAVAKEDAIPTAEMTPRVRELLASLTDEVEVLRRDLQSTRDRLELAERVADQDHLLTVLNRRAFVRELARHIGLVARYGTPASLLYLDLDGFKRINDTYGHACGDAVLAHFAQLLSVNVRDSDIVGRLGGDEFAILLAHATPAQAERKASSLLDALAAQPPLWNEKRLAVSFSFGAIALLAADTPDLAMMRADEGMYAQKRANR